MDTNLEYCKAEYAIGRYRLAIQFAEYVLAKDAESFDALVIAGMSYLTVNEINAGIGMLEEAALLRPLPCTVQIELAIAYGATGATELSRDLLMSVATGGQSTPDEMLRIAVGLEAIDEPRLAMEACRNAGAVSPESAEVHYRMGYYAQRCGHSTSTIEALLRRAIHLDPRNIHYRIGLASMLIRLERRIEAMGILDAVIPNELSSVTCECCLKRIANLYFDFDRLETSRLCAQRLQVLRQHKSESQRNLLPQSDSTTLSVN
ncbi:hypothetical protein C2E31_23055 [Rhodopirellula baltica]|nr:hypothetical protein C2E31_23055 [Rhodopirellula baltica]